MVLLMRAMQFLALALLVGAALVPRFRVNLIPLGLWPLAALSMTVVVMLARLVIPSREVTPRTDLV